MLPDCRVVSGRCASLSDCRQSCPSSSSGGGGDSCVLIHQNASTLLATGELHADPQRPPCVRHVVVVHDRSPVALPLERLLRTFDRRILTTLYTSRTRAQPPLSTQVSRRPSRQGQGRHRLSPPRRPTLCGPKLLAVPNFGKLCRRPKYLGCSLPIQLAAHRRLGQDSFSSISPSGTTKTRAGICLHRRPTLRGLWRHHMRRTKYRRL